MPWKGYLTHLNSYSIISDDDVRQISIKTTAPNMEPSSVKIAADHFHDVH